MIAGETLEIVEELNDGWWIARRANDSTQRTGEVPSNFLTPLLKNGKTIVDTPYGSQPAQPLESPSPVRIQRAGGAGKQKPSNRDKSDDDRSDVDDSMANDHDGPVDDDNESQSQEDGPLALSPLPSPGARRNVSRNRRRDTDKDKSTKSKSTTVVSDDDSHDSNDLPSTAPTQLPSTLQQSSFRSPQPPHRKSFVIGDAPVRVGAVKDGIFTEQELAMQQQAHPHRRNDRHGAGGGGEEYDEDMQTERMEVSHSSVCLSFA